MGAFKDELNNKPFIGWTDGFKVNNPTVLDLDTIKKTYEELKNWANNIEGSCVPGRIVSVIGDTTEKNGVYVVGTVKRETGEDAIIIKISNLTTTNSSTGLVKVINGTSLPETPQIGDNDKIHLLKSSDDAGNSYDEYIYILGTGWEKIGNISINTDVNLDNYYTSKEVDNKLSTINTNFAKLGSDVEGLESNISGISNEIDAEIEALNNSLKSLEDGKVAINGRNITALLENLNELSTATYNEEDFSLSLNFKISGSGEGTTTIAPDGTTTSTSQPGVSCDN